MIPRGKWISAAVAMGGNEGDVEAAFAAALGRLDADPSVRVEAVSSLWRTAPWGVPDQPDFLNAVALLCSRYDAPELLARLREEEEAAGRKRTVRWGPRPLDLDLLWFDSEIRHDARLALPHPHLAERSFVMEPALEVAPAWTHPQTGQTLRALRDRLAAAGEWTRCEKVEGARLTCRS